jgi:hypothetical protein
MPKTKAIIEEVRQAVKEHPGEPREFYVGYLSSRHTYASIREAIRRAVADGDVEVKKTGPRRNNRRLYPNLPEDRGVRYPWQKE